MRRWWRLLWGRCPNCGEKLLEALHGGRMSLRYLDCFGCGYYLHPESGYEHFPNAVRS